MFFFVRNVRNSDLSAARPATFRASHPSVGISSPILLPGFQSLSFTAVWAAHKRNHGWMRNPCYVHFFQRLLDGHQPAFSCPLASQLTEQRFDAVPCFGKVDPAAIRDQRRQRSLIEQTRDYLGRICVDRPHDGLCNSCRTHLEPGLHSVGP